MILLQFCEGEHWMNDEQIDQHRLKYEVIRGVNIYVKRAAFGGTATKSMAEWLVKSEI